ncbi:MAG TPA: hypothetical protein VGT44_15610, partial [Ktedonobacteraceae bacterium]|nr:hypothetical protein [Ktedonobacteraceae bacterium]
MNQHGAWSPYAGGGAIILAVVLLIVTGVLTYSGIRLRHPLAVKRPGTLLGVTIVVIWLVSVITFLVAITVYVLALYQQAGGHINAPTNPITPVTMVSGAIAFF